MLSDPEKRERYDRLGANWRQGDDVAGAPGFDGFGRPRADGVRFEFGDGAFSDFFESLFGSARTGDIRMRGADQEAVVDLSLEEAAAGGPLRVSLGDGRSFTVNVPAGVRDGQRIRVAGRGGEGIGGGSTGDLFLRVHLRPHRVFRVDGRDLHVDVLVTPWDAALGTTLQVPTLTGSAKVRLPAGSSSGRRLRLRGKGMPGRRSRHGDLYARVQIMVPDKLGERERKLFEELRTDSSFHPQASVQ